MKRTALSTSLALATATMCGVAFADGPIDGKIYGKINISYQVNDNEQDGGDYSLNSNASRFGFKGDSLLEDVALSVIYKIEFETYIDDGEKNADQTLKQRNSYVGLRGGFGTVKAGKFDTPLKKAQGKFDLFGDLSGDIKAVMEGENRASNILQYSSPKIADGVVLTAAIIPGEESTDSEADGPADGLSASISYKNDTLYLALAIDSKIDGQDTQRLVVSYSVDDLTVSGMVQSAETTDGSLYAHGENSADSTGVSIAYKIDKNTLKLQYVDSDSTSSVAAGEQLSLGVDHKLSKKTKLFAFYTDQDAIATSNQTSYIGFGLEHKF